MGGLCEIRKRITIGNESQQEPWHSYQQSGPTQLNNLPYHTRVGNVNLNSRGQIWPANLRQDDGSTNEGDSERQAPTY